MKPSRPLLWNGLHLLALWGLAGLQPTLSVVADTPDFFTTRKVDGLAFVAAVVLYALLPPAALLAVEALAARAGPAWRDRLHLVFIWGLLALLVLSALKWAASGGGAELVVVACLVAMAGALVYSRTRFARSLLSALAPAPLLFVLLFLFGSAAKDLVFPGGGFAGLPPSERMAPVVLVVFDELPVSSLMRPDGTIDPARYPAFASLARNATWYRNTVASGDETQEAVPAILTGKRVGFGRAPVYTRHPRNLFTLFGRTHEVRALEYLTWLCPPRICPSDGSGTARVGAVLSAMSLVYLHAIAPEKIEAKLPTIGRTWAEALASEDPRHAPPTDASSAEIARHGDVQFRRFLQLFDEAPGRRPVLAFLHSSLPHLPWMFLPSGGVYDRPPTDLPGLDVSELKWAQAPRLVEQGYQRHLLQVRFADRLLHRLLERLRASGLYDDALVAVVADHGIAFHPGEQGREVTRRNAADVGMVPFFVKAPRQREGRIDDRVLQTIDVLPTLVGALGLQVPGPIDGRAGGQLPPGGRPRATITRHRGRQRLVAATAPLRKLRDRTVLRQARLFGTDPRALFAAGRNRDLLGMPLSRLRYARAEGLTVDIARSADYASTDLGGRYVPALVEGQITGPGSADIDELAVAVNGRVAATGPTYDLDGRPHFKVVVPPGALVQGENRLQVLAVGRQGGTSRLELLSGGA